MMQHPAAKDPGLSLVIPVYRNEANVGDLLDALEGFAVRYQMFEAVLVVDGSPDRSWELLRAGLIERRIPAQLLLLSRNFGAFAAIRRGLEVARHDVTAVMAADLQEPPELIDQFHDAIAAGDVDLAVGVRRGRSDGVLRGLVSNLFWRLYRRFVLPDVPRGGVDVFAVSNEVRDVVVSMRESNSSLVAQLLWVGFRRAEVPYERRRRDKGRSAWTRRKRFQYMLDSVFSFSDVPIMALLWMGLVGVLLTSIASVTVLVSWWAGRITVPGYTPLILGVLFIGSLLIVGQGIVGAYVWRAAENTKMRPLSVTALHEEFGPGGSKGRSGGADARG